MTCLNAQALKGCILFISVSLMACFANPTPHPNTGEDNGYSMSDTSSPGPTSGTADTSGEAADRGADAAAPRPDAGANLPDAAPEPADVPQLDGADIPADLGIFDALDVGEIEDAALEVEDIAADIPEPEDAADAAQDDATPPDCSATYPTPIILRCGAAYEVFSYWADLANSACPDWFSPDGPEPVVYDTVEALASAEGCDANCLYDATKSVDFLTCDGPKSGYDVYEADDKNCTGPLHYTPDGIFEDLCQWEAYACYCTP